MNKLQLEEFKILEVLHDFCEKGGFDYFLYGGTLLGAVRHGGFIPWDDDIDIAIPRKQFDEFERQIVKSNLVASEFIFQSNKYSLDYCSPIFKLRSKTLDVIEHVSSTQAGYVGPWVDVFAYDNVPDSIELRRKQFRKVSKYNRLISFFTLTSAEAGSKGLVNAAKKKIQWINEKSYKHYFFLNYLYKKRYNHMTKYQDVECIYSADLSYMFYKNFEDFESTMIQNKSLKNMPKIQFEMGEFYQPNQTHDYLQNLYGDYMVLPDVEDRKIHKIEF